MKRNKGITLIALVITIIILLILAGITIAMLTGENGIITQAIKSKELTEKRAEEEKKDLEELNKLIEDMTGEIFTKVDDPTPGDITDGGKQDGTSEKPYKIQSVEDLVAFVQEANKSENNLFLGKLISVENNLDIASKNSYVDSNNTTFGDLSGDGQVKGLLEELTDKSGSGLPIIDDFSGTIDGKHKTIKNYYRKLETKVSKNAFIGTLEKEGNIKNISFQGDTVYKLDALNNPWLSIGAIVSRNYGTINNCKLDVDVNVEVKNATTDGSYICLVGTIVGSNAGTINNCINYGNINVNYEENLNTSNTTIDLAIGGISGFLNGDIKNTVINTINYGNINVNVNSIGTEQGNDVCIGGIVGDVDNNSEIENTANFGNIKIVANKGVNVGGGFGLVRERATSLNIENIFNKGNIQAIAGINSGTSKADLEMGGVIGDAYGSSISKLFNIGTITDNNDKKTDFYGGIVADKHNNTFPDSYYLASVAPYGVEAGLSSSEAEGITRVDNLTTSDVIRYMNTNVDNHNTNSNSKNMWKKWKINNSQNVVFE